MKSIRLSACTLLLLASCAMTGVQALAATARVTVDVGSKDIASTNTLALGENALVLVRNLGDSQPADLFVSLHDRRNGEILAGASNFVADIQTSVWTNWSWSGTSSVPSVVSSTVTNAIGYLPLDTTNLFARFAGLPVTAERTFILSVYDASNRWVLGQDDISIRNSALWSAPTSSPFKSFPDYFLDLLRETNAVLSAALSAHISDTNNPHNVTAAQLGALTAESDPLALPAIQAASNALSSTLSAHVSDTNNPHRVTLEQLNQSDELGTLLFAYGINAWLNEGLKYITWTDHRVDLENGTFYGAWNFSAYPPSFDGARLTTTNDINAAMRDMDDALSADFEYLLAAIRATSNAIPSASGFPLTNNADFASFSATNVGSIQLAGATNELAVVDGKLKYGGKSVAGVANLTAGRNIELSTNETTEAVTVATTDDVSFGDVEVVGNLTLANEQIDSWDDIAYTRQTTIYATNWYTVQTNIYNTTTNIYNAPISNTYYTTQVTYTNCTFTNIHYLTTVSNSYWADTLYTSNYYADRVVQPMITVTNGTISLWPDVQLYVATPQSGTAFDVDLSALDAPPNCAITFEMLLYLGASVSNVTFMSTNTLSWLEGDAPVIPQGARSILVFRSYDLTNWVGNLQGILP